MKARVQWVSFVVFGTATVTWNLVYIAKQFPIVNKNKVSKYLRTKDSRPERNIGQC